MCVQVATLDGISSKPESMVGLGQSSFAWEATMLGNTA